MGKIKSDNFVIDAKNINYRDLNFKIKQAVSLSKNDNSVIVLENVIGQRYIGDGIKGRAVIKIYGTPGNDMAAFIDGPVIEVFGNGQDGIGNTMNSGKIIIHGDCGDIIGYSMRGGEIYIKGNVGWRSGIHMKSYLEKFPIIIIGGKAGNFLGEYMAGGVIIVLGLNLTGKNSDGIDDGIFLRGFHFDGFYTSSNNSMVGDYIGAGMHGGVIYLRKDVEDYKIGREVKKMAVDSKDIEILSRFIKNFCGYFNIDYKKIITENFKDFKKLVPFSHRPYGKLYAY